MSTNTPVYADVALNLAGKSVFTYTVPTGLLDSVQPGKLVSIPFSAKKAIGCVVALRDVEHDIDPMKILPIAGVASPEYKLDDQLIELARFISNYYFCELGQALSAISLTGFYDVRTQRSTLYKLRGDWRDVATALKPNQTTACERLEENGFPSLPKTALASAGKCTAPTIEKLMAKGLVHEVDPRTAFDAKPSENNFSPGHQLNERQQEAVNLIIASISKNEFQAFLLHGITGSGKTEVYLQAMEHALRRGRTALCLVPEISLTPQTISRFEERFQEEIGVFHSQLTRRAKLELFNRIKANNIRIVVGARSAVFAALPNLGVIVVDEEHDSSYKQGETPRYQARDIAVVRASRENIPIIMGSATPSIESYHNAESGKYTLIRLTERPTGAPLPSVRIVDLAQEASKSPDTSLFSQPLQRAIVQRLDKSEQTLLFLNRRGFSNFIFCPSCKWVARCEEDDVALTVHRRGKNTAKNDELDLFSPSGKEQDLYLRCHFCGVSMDAPHSCPECKAEDLMTIGAGTQRTEEDLQAIFPDANILRLDYDTTGGRDGFLKAWERINSGEVDIILGTQMIAKGLHLEPVTLVGVVLADIGLFLPDFRAEERTFQLLTQVAGRAGRTSAGEVIFQTYMPKHASIGFAVHHDFEGFYQHEIKRRRQLGFPPFCKMIAITISDENRERAFKAARQLSYLLSRVRSSSRVRDVSINGPTIAPISRLAGRFRYRILLRAPAMNVLSPLLRRALQHPEWKIASSTRLAIDADPADLL